MTSFISRQMLAAGASAILLSACASFDGIAPGPRPNAASAYAADALSGGSGQWPAADAFWADALGGALLQGLVDEALAGNPGMAIAAARVSASRALAESVRGAALPTVGASFDGTYQRFTENGMVPAPLAGTYGSNNQLALNFSYEFDFWGKHAAQLGAALSQEKMAEAELHGARLVLTAAVAQAWVQLARQSAQLDLVGQQQALHRDIGRLTQQRIAAGLDMDSDAQQVRLQGAALQAEQLQWQQAIALTRNQLAALLGQGPDRGHGIACPALPQVQAFALPAQLPLALLGRRPDIVAARWQVEAAQGEIDSSRAQFYPNVNLLGFAGFSSLGLSNLLDGGSRIVGIGPALRLPIFEGGQLRAQLKGRVAAYDGAVASYNQSLTQALHEVADQLQSLQASDQQLRNQDLALQAARQNLQLAQQRWQVGTANRLQVLAAESVWLGQRKLALDLQARRTELQVGMIKALGGGFEADRHAL
ncbi:efflux transporter outer membrane subunit [Herminiimonas sp. CN]|uniref:efflux transporter outer membrane subunit n=1 Tax=Herminiimonas sp. CN TaxID=1349818 RepID=UPI00054F2160|nr:efflux transporter outer membrane subunit [Herminiimonas sp. CN]